MCNWMVTFTTNSFLQPILCVKMPSHALGAICWTFVARRILALSTGEQKCRLRACWWAPGDRAFAHRVRAWLGPKNQGFGGGVVELSLWLQSCERWRRWHKTNPGLVIFGWSSGKPKSAPSAGSDGRWLHILGTLKDLRSETNEAVPNHHGASAGWCDRLDCCIVSSASDTAIALEGQGWTHTRPAQSLQRNAAFFCDSSQKKKKTQLSLKAPEHFGVGVLSSFWSRMLRLSCFHQIKPWVGTIEVACSTISIVWVQEIFKCLIERFSWPRFSLKDDVPAWFLRCAQFLDPFQISKVSHWQKIHTNPSISLLLNS